MSEGKYAPAVAALARIVTALCEAQIALQSDDIAMAEKRIDRARAAISGLQIHLLRVV